MEQNITFRPRMDDDLQAIDNKVLSMSELVETQILNAVKAIKEKDMISAIL